MITRTTKYTASDGTEHDSPQAAATFDLAQTILQIGGTFTPMHENMAEKLALSPEALRDALDAYFEDLEAHPDLGCDPAYFDDYYQMDPAIVRKMLEEGILAEATEEEIHRGTSCDKPLSPWTLGQGNPNDPTTWRADLPVDHPSYCRPFGTRED